MGVRGCCNGNNQTRGWVYCAPVRERSRFGKYKLGFPSLVHDWETHHGYVRVNSILLVLITGHEYEGFH